MRSIIAKLTCEYRSMSAIPDYTLSTTQIRGVEVHTSLVGLAPVNAVI